ncbi:hypothetical protein C6380_07295 [Pseudomonas syringae pv. actinidiae]|nr:hypothetical protein BUE61_09920 [Pseudomonas syringae pv. actinidiae]PBK57010.1 hypothetical protein BUE60_02040 [Pseudomonas syringae pv. actinidiae]RJX54421.1 hypothetical protein C6383_26600 [Pseudomonas syringae pv. actinidiae]RJX59254.1 hypothetical protein C6380_07295 [Pseudomonas syringae pv. actinidiae]RJY22996.1 hypothetical protein C6381_07550 [Pseudomonas syringae pv. actinidiae]
MKYMEGLKPQQMSDWLYKSLLMLQAWLAENESRSAQRYPCFCMSGRSALANVRSFLMPAGATPAGINDI